MDSSRIKIVVTLAFFLTEDKEMKIEAPQNQSTNFCKLWIVVH